MFDNCTAKENKSKVERQPGICELRINRTKVDSRYFHLIVIVFFMASTHTREGNRQLGAERRRKIEIIRWER